MMGAKETENVMHIHVGNLSPHTSLSDLVGCFTAFGLVEMPSDARALAAIEGLKDKKLDGKLLKVRED